MGVDSVDDKTFMESLRTLLIIVKSDMPWLDDMLCADLSDDPYGVSIFDLSAMLALYHLVKDAGYGRSWARRGDVGVFNNVMRKSDRLEQLVPSVYSCTSSDLIDALRDEETFEELAIAVMSGHDKVDESMRVALIDNLLDKALYNMMWVAFIAKIRPGDFRTWVRDVWCKTTNTDYSAVADIIGADDEDTPLC